MQTDLLIFLLTFPQVFQQNFITQTHNQKNFLGEHCQWLPLLVQLSNLPGNLMVYYTVAKICWHNFKHNRLILGNNREDFGKSPKP